MVVDWTHTARGAGASDVALTWSSLACFDHDATGLMGQVATRFRAAFLEGFLAAAGRTEGFLCLLYFEANIEASDYYAVELASRGDLSFSRAELADQGYVVGVSLGD